MIDAGTATRTFCYAMDAAFEYSGLLSSDDPAHRDCSAMHRTVLAHRPVV